MKFENKGKWFMESEEQINTDDLLAEDELDLAEEDIDDDSEGIFNDKDEACKHRNEAATRDQINDWIEDHLAMNMTVEKTADAIRKEFPQLDRAKLIANLNKYLQDDERDFPYTDAIEATMGRPVK